MTVSSPERIYTHCSELVTLNTGPATGAGRKSFDLHTRFESHRICAFYFESISNPSLFDGGARAGGIGRPAPYKSKSVLAASDLFDGAGLSLLGIRRHMSSAPNSAATM